jgi:hypothetical protein
MRNNCGNGVIPCGWKKLFLSWKDLHLVQEELGHFGSLP